MHAVVREVNGEILSISLLPDQIDLAKFLHFPEVNAEVLVIAVLAAPPGCAVTIKGILCRIRCIFD